MTSRAIIILPIDDRRDGRRTDMPEQHDFARASRRDFVKGATLAASVGVTSFAPSDVQAGTLTSEPLTSDEIRAMLKLEPNATCGFVRETYISKLSIALGGLPAPFADGRPAGSALYFMMTPAAPVTLHRIRNDQLYHYHLGDPLEPLMLHADGTHTLATVGRTFVPNRARSSSSPVTLSILRASSASAHGSLARAPNGRGWFRPKTWSSATQKRWWRATPTSPPRSAASLCRLHSRDQIDLASKEEGA
jgi:predicted cupin superfamily sugar epimerase